MAVFRLCLSDGGERIVEAGRAVRTDSGRILLDRGHRFAGTVGVAGVLRALTRGGRLPQRARRRGRLHVGSAAGHRPVVELLSPQPPDPDQEMSLSLLRRVAAKSSAAINWTRKVSQRASATLR